MNLNEISNIRVEWRTYNIFLIAILNNSLQNVLYLFFNELKWIRLMTYTNSRCIKQLNVRSESIQQYSDSIGIYWHTRDYVLSSVNAHFYNSDNVYTVWENNDVSQSGTTNTWLRSVYAYYVCWTTIINI